MCIQIVLKYSTLVNVLKLLSTTAHLFNVYATGYFILKFLTEVLRLHSGEGAWHTYRWG